MYDNEVKINLHHAIIESQPLPTFKQAGNPKQNHPPLFGVVPLVLIL